MGAGQLPPLGKLNAFFSNIVFEFAGLYFFLYTGDSCEGVRSLSPQTKNSRYGPEYQEGVVTKS